MKRYLPLFVLAVGPFPVAAADLRADIGKLVAPHLRDAKGVGIVVGVLTKDGRQVFGYGKLKLKGERSPDGDTVFEIGSLTKLFTALMLADMARAGEIKLDDPLRLYLPEKVAVPKHGDKEITLRHLATHTSGLSDQLPLAAHLLLHPDDAENPYAHFGEKEIYRALGVLELDRDPGSNFEYSNIGMGLLGNALVRKAKAKNYEELVVRRVCEPLGLADTRVTLSDRQKARLAPGHDEENEPTSGWDFASIEGCGALRSTANDLLTFLEAQTGRRKTALLPAMEECQKLHFKDPKSGRHVGLGWLLADLPDVGKTLAAHEGGTGGYRSWVGFFKGGKVGVVVLCNSAKIGDDIEEVGVEVLKLLDPKPE